MLKSVLNKIKNNIGRFICLVVGSVLITGVITCIPIYSNGTLKQMLATDLDNYENKAGKPSGQMLFEAKLPEVNVGNIRADAAEEYIDKVLDNVEKKGPELLNHYARINAAYLKSSREESFVYSTAYKLSCITGVEDNITITKGRMYSDNTADNVVEVILFEETYEENPAVELGSIYSFSSSLMAKSESVKIKPVGVFKIKNEASPYWYDTQNMFKKTMLADVDAFKTVMYSGEYPQMLTDVSIYCNLDFRGMSIESLPSFISYYNGLYRFASDLGNGKGSVSLNCSALVNEYIEKSADMQLSLWILNIPIIAMLALYMVMIARMIMDEDLNEISTFKSRGAKTGYVFARYVIECGIISVAAVIAGPFAGLFAAKYIGSSAGFLEFSKAEEIIDASLSVGAYVYAIIACVLFSAMILFPAIGATRRSIVKLKQTRARKSRFAWWEKGLVDVVCLVVSVGLFFIYKRTGGFNTDGSVDPVVYVISSLFILGCCLLFIRLYPIIVALVFTPFKRILPATIYSAYTQVSRSGNDYRFLMLFLAMTLSVGIYSSGSARIINNNVTDSVNYQYGADVVVKPDFTEYAPYEEIEIAPEDGWTDGEFTPETIITGYEPVPESFRSFPLDKYKGAEYVKAVSRVFYGSDLFVMPESKVNYENKGYTFMAIDPAEFGKIAWCGNDLNDRSFNTYLNVLNSSPTAVLVSRPLAERYEIEVGQTLWVDINGSNEYGFEHWESMPCIVGGIVDYWPTAVAFEEGREFEEGERIGCLGKNFVIMNFEYLYSVRDTSSFSLFMSITDEAKALGIDDFAEKMTEDGLIADRSQIEVFRPEKVSEKKNDSMLKAVNGCFSIGFVSTLTVAFVGFVFFWIMNVRKRKLQFGILRAMGLTKGKLTLMLLWEHLLTTGTSVIVGTVVGAFTVRIFAPLLKIAYNDGILPLEVLFNRGDNIKIFMVVGLMLAAGIVVLAGYIGKLKINEAVKIGEE